MRSFGSTTALPSRIAGPRGATELEATIEISRWASASLDAGEATEAILAAAARAPGVARIAIDWLSDTPSAQDFGLLRPGKPYGTAVADIQDGPVRLGILRLIFGLDKIRLQNPLGFARYVAQQIAGVRRRAALRDRSELLRAEVAMFEDELGTRKTFHRARGLLARSRGIPEGGAGELIRAQARQSGRTVREVSEALVVAHRPSIARQHEAAQRRIA